MKTIALISGGKDSCFCMMHAVAHGHDIVALANLHPPQEASSDELDSFMYQTVGHEPIALYSECMGIPLYRQEITGSSKNTGPDYTHTEQDEVEDLFHLLLRIKNEIPDVEAVCTGAILSNYQRVRVENVCLRLGLSSLAYLWKRDQQELLKEMIDSQLESVLVKVASIGLDQKHLGKSIRDMYPHLIKMNQLYGVHVCGEGGEYETLTLDCPLFLKKLHIKESKIIIHSDDAFAQVAYLKIEASCVDKNVPHVPVLQRLSHELKEALLNSQDLTFSKSPNINTETSHLALPPQWNIPTDPILEQSPKFFKMDPFFCIPGFSAWNSNQLSLQEEIHYVMSNIENTLKEHQLNWTHVLLIHVYVSDMSLFGKINKIYSSYFGINPPARYV